MVARNKGVDVANRAAFVGRLSEVLRETCQ